MKKSVIGKRSEESLNRLKESVMGSEAKNLIFYRTTVIEYDINKVIKVIFVLLFNIEYMFNSFQRFLLASLSGVLMSLPWYESFSDYFIFIALVPLLILEDSYSRQKTSKNYGLFWYSLLCFFIWNVLTTWWIGNATMIGAISLITLNSLLYAIVFWLFHFSKNKIGLNLGKLILIVYWIAFEHIYLRTEISWPWLNLGNGFANSIKLIQWYEYTGTLGGTLWVLIINVLIAEIVADYLKNKSFSSYRNKIAVTSAILLIPVIYSLVRYSTYKEEPHPISIVVIQPNIDPYSEKFGGISHEKQLNIILEEANNAETKDVDYYIAPETAVQGDNSENILRDNWAVKSIKQFLRNHSKANFIIGAETVKEYNVSEEKPHTAQLNDKEGWYDRYNSALQVDTTNTIQIYHKSQLVLGVEKMPYSKYLGFLKKYSINLGGAFGGLGYQKNRVSFKSSKNDNRIAPIICYESIYGEYVTDYVKTDANLLVVITNDGWWKNTPGLYQHLNISRIRAIETRRSVARSANNGISALINQRGEIIQFIEYENRGSIAGNLNANDNMTFYVKHGDYLGIIAIFLSLLSMGFTLLNLFMVKEGRSDPSAG